MLESYITPMLMGYINKYVKNIKPSDLQVSFWGGDVVLRNLELRLDVLEQELRYPLQITSGRIRELVLHIPWNAILSKPVEVEINDIEIVIKLKSIRLNTPATTNQDRPDAPQSDEATASIISEDAPKENADQTQQGYLQGYTNRILNNLTFHVQNLVVKVIEEECDLMMSFNIQSLKFGMADEQWMPSYVCTDYCDGDYSLNKVLEVSDMVVHLQPIDSDRAHMEALKDLFVRKCSFSCQMQSQYHGKKFFKKYTCILFDSLVFHADENQFSLFFHLTDWLLAMYYNGKRLKGRDDGFMKSKFSQQVGLSPASETDGSTLPDVMSSYEDVFLGGKVEDVQMEAGEGGREGGGGWGSWMWSFVATDEADGGENGGEENKDSLPLAESSTFSIMAKSITVNLKVTHHGRVPVFSSPRSRSRTVLSAVFSGCSARVDNVSSTQLFTVSLGIMAIQAWVTGFCSCSDAIPASWKLSSDSHEKVPVFSLGDTTSCDTELVITGSLFDPEKQGAASSNLQLLLPTPELLLAPRPEFSAVWFTYEYYDVGPAHPCEVCEERLQVGEINFLLSPDTLHRVSHFTSAYGESVKACPLFTEGMVVLGDPKAETSFKIAVTGGRAVVVSNTHYLPSFSSSSNEHTKLKPPLKILSLSLPPSSHTLPTLTVSLARSTVSITLAMYSGNASLENPQRSQMRVALSQLVIADGGEFSLSPKQSELKRIVSAPKLEIYSHSKTTADGKVIKENDSSYLQLHVEEISCVASAEQVSRTSFIVSSWYNGPFVPGHPKTKTKCLSSPEISGGHLHISVKEVELTKSVMVSYTFLSATVDSFGVVLLCDSTKGRLCHAIPVVYGPISTVQWNKTDAYTSTNSYEQGDGSTSRMLEFFTALPHKDTSEKSYPTLQLSLGGLALCVDSTVLDFVKCIPALIGRELPKSDHVKEPSQQMAREPGTDPSVHSEDTATDVIHTSDASAKASSDEGDFIAKLKSYATKVDIQPVLIVILAKPLEEGLMSTEVPEFPVLPALRENDSMEALLLSLPQLSLISAKSHVLEEPVPRASSTSTFPWDCTLRHASIIAFREGTTPFYILEPLSVAISLADQQGGTGVTVHTDLVAVSLSKKEGELLSGCVSQVVDTLSLLLAPPVPEGSEDSGVHSSDDPLPSPHRHPSHLSSPALSTITTATVTTLPTHTSLGNASSTSSLYTNHGFSTLWVQAIVSKATLTIYAPLPPNPLPTTTSSSVERHSVSAQSKTSSTGSFMTPLTSPTVEIVGPITYSLPTDIQTEGYMGRKNGGRDRDFTGEESEMAKFSIEVDGVSVQFDVQEKCTDLIVKVLAVGANLHRRNCGRFASTGGKGGGRSGGVWIPYLSSEKILSSKGTALPAELSEILIHSSSAAIHLPQGHTVSSDSFRNFITLELNIPRQSVHRAAGLKLKIQSFEAVVWLPVVDMVSSVLGSLQLSRQKKVEVATPHDPADIGSWPAVETTVECCRLVLPSSDYSNSILCNIGCVTVSHSLDYPTTDVRYVISASAFRRLARLSSEKKQPPLPAYQLDLLAMSVWGIQRQEGGSAQVLLYAGSSDIRMIYTPALYWRPTVVGTTHKPAILACGHCLEVNFRTDLDLMLGPEQVDCISTILRTNTVSLATPTHSSMSPKMPTTPVTTPSHPSAAVGSSKTRHPSVPFKGLVSGTTVRLTLVSSHSPTGEEAENFVDSASESSEFVFPTLHGLDSSVVPLAQLQLFNIICGVTTTTSGGYLLEGSCFNMSVGYSGSDNIVCSYSDLVDAGMTSSLMDRPLLETRRGHSQNMREIPPSVVAIAINVHLHKPPALTVDISRPVKLTLTPKLITKLSEFSDSILKSIESQHGTKPLNAPTATEDIKSSEESVTKDEMETQEPQREKKNPAFSDAVGSTGNSVQVKLKVMQVLVEFQISTRCVDLADGDNDRELCASIGEEMEAEHTGAVSVAEEGFILAWDHLDLAYPNISGFAMQQTSVTGDLHVSGLQLLSIMSYSTNPVVLPTQLNCFLIQRTPSSPLDLGYLTANLSCGLLDLKLSREVLDLASRVLQTITNSFASQEGDTLTGETEPVIKKEEKVVHFHDDLRAGDFTFVKDSDVAVGYSPQPGEVFFSLGEQDGSTFMMWHYHEPRVITKLAVLPVPFSFTSEADAPIDIEVGCTLDYWDEDRGIFSVLQEFRLTETTPTEVIVSRVVGSRKWRIAIVEVEWDDEEEGVRFVSSSSDMVDGEGSPVPIAAILSPVLLAGGTCVDSYFSPSLVPVLDLSLTCHKLQATLVHNSPPYPGRYGEYEVVQLTKGPQELVRLHVEHLTCHLKQTRSTGTTFQGDGHLSIELIDFLDLSWRVALHPTHLHVHLDRKIHLQKVEPGSRPSKTGNEGCMLYDASLKCSPAVLRFSQGLLHTTSLSLHTWTMEKEGEDGGMAVEKSAVILNHFILCNNTLQDLHFGQVSTDEVTALRSRQCIGYSWRNTKITPQCLHLCIVTDGVWRWTKPFSISKEGTQSIEVYIGRHTALVHIHVANIGGLQRKVTLTGNWTFSSALPFPLHLSLISTLDQGDRETPFEPRETLLLPPKLSLPSVVVPESQLSGVRVRSPQSNDWSEVYPIHSTTDEWSKPQLLTEIEYSSGHRVNLWYNIKPLHTSRKESVGSQITFSPLFAICNHLPFDLTMVATETNSSGPAPTPLPECVLSGEGERTVLCGLHASTWYHLSFRRSGCEAVSEPTVSLSTFLLVHLPFSEQEVGEKQDEEKKLRDWPYDDEEAQFGLSGVTLGNSMKVMLPSVAGSQSCLHAVLERDPFNTITLHLLPDVLVINRSPITLQLLTENTDLLEELTNERGEGVKEIVSTLDPNNVSLLPQNKFHLLTEWEGKTLVSQALIAKPDKEKEKEENKPTNVILTESESNEDFGVFGNLTLTRSFKGAMAILSITPTYVFHNSTPYDLHVSASLFHPDTHRAQTGLHTPLVIEHVPSQTSMPLSFCEHIEMEGTGETVQALSLRTSCEDRRWSLPLSSDFVRHSFALPTSNEIYLKAVLTMHEHSNTIYMVASIDPSPRLLIQNHTQQHLEIVEESTGGVHSFPQKLPPAQEVSYEPPTYAKQYPIVFDDEVTHSEAVNQTKEKLARVVVKFRLDHTQLDAEDEGTEIEWSDPFYLSSGSDRVISIPEGNSMLVSTHKRGTTLHLSLLPTGPAVSFLPISNTTEVDSPISRVNVEMAIDLRLEQMVVCIDDETTEDFELIQEILQVIVDGAALQFSNGVGSDGSSLELTVDSFHINNMMERDGGAFAVTVIPRAHHHRRASLIDSEPTPLASLSVHYSPHSPNLIELIRISLRPLTLQLEDELLNRLKCVVTSFSNPGVLRTPLPGRKNRQGSTVTPKLVLAEAERDVIPLAVTKLVIESAAFYLNARISLRVLLSCNDSPFRFSRYELRNIYSNWTEVSQTVASRYVMSTIAHIGWLLGSLELIGSPGTFIQNVGRGLRDLVTLPYQGLTRSPTWFLLGIGQGTMSFIQHFSSGALGSVTSMASSISHNMERLSLDPHHVSYQTQQRQQRPATHFTRGLVSGASSLGLSLMSAVAGIVEQPMQSYHQIEGPVSPAVAARSILKGVGKGLLGAVTKPVGGVMELVSQTGQGLMHGTGLAKRLSHKPVKVQSFTGSVTRISLQCSSTACAVKLGGDVPLLLSTPVRYTTPNGTTNPALLLLTHERIYLLDSTKNTFQQMFSVCDHSLDERDSGASNPDEVEIEIVANSTQSTEMPRFHKVEYFLRQSCEKRSSAESIGEPPIAQLAASPTLDWSDPELGPADQASDRVGVKLLIPTHHAAQLLSFFNSLSRLSLNAHTAFPVHRTVKSESFFSTTS